MHAFLRRTIIVILVTAILFGPSATSLAQEGMPPPQPDAANGPAIYLPLVTNDGGSATESVQAETVSESEISLDEDTPVENIQKPVGAQDDISEGEVPPEPDFEEPLPADDDQSGAPEDQDTMEAAATDGWSVILNEGFEGAFPYSGWRVLDANGTSYGEYYWDDDDYKPYSGSWSAWAANGGRNALDPQRYNYPNNMRSWMIYGPFSLSNATDAELLFNYWNRSELNYDYFGWYASTNGSNFYGYRRSGDSYGWRSVNFDLTRVPTLGNLAGKPSVWIAFVFTSDGSVTNKGPFVDNVKIQKLVNSVSCPNQYKAEYFNNRFLSGSPAVTRCENWPINHNWGDGSPVSGVGSDNFSVRWTGSAYFTAGTYNFKARADDGIKVWLDNSLLINGWRDQPATEYVATRYVLGGNHSVQIEYYEAGGGASASFQWNQGVNGIDYHTANTKILGMNDYYVFKIDMQSSNLSFETVMAQDSTNVNQGKATLTNPRERVGDMATRYRARNPVFVVNADYSSPDNYRDHGPEGLTVKNGQRYDGVWADPDDSDDNEWKKSSLSITSSKGIRIGKQTACTGSTSCRSWAPDRSAFYNTVGGGPLFIQNSARIGGISSTTPCSNEGHSTAYCTERRQWTAVGMSADGRYLIITVTGVDGVYNMDDAARILLAEGASRAMKLDGGGSSQVWYRPYGSVVYSSRPIANAIMVFSN